MTKITLTSPRYVIKKIKKKTNAENFKDLVPGDIIWFSFDLVHPGVCSKKTLSSYLDVHMLHKNIVGDEIAMESHLTVAAVMKRISCFSLWKER